MEENMNQNSENQAGYATQETVPDNQSVSMHKHPSKGPVILAIILVFALAVVAAVLAKGQMKLDSDINDIDMSQGSMEIMQDAMTDEKDDGMMIDNNAMTMEKDSMMMDDNFMMAEEESSMMMDDTSSTEADFSAVEADLEADFTAMEEDFAAMEEDMNDLESDF